MNVILAEKIARVAAEVLGQRDFAIGPEFENSKMISDQIPALGSDGKLQFKQVEAEVFSFNLVFRDKTQERSITAARVHIAKIGEVFKAVFSIVDPEVIKTGDLPGPKDFVAVRNGDITASSVDECKLELATCVADAVNEKRFAHLGL